MVFCVAAVVVDDVGDVAAVVAIAVVIVLVAGVAILVVVLTIAIQFLNESPRVFIESVVHVCCPASPRLQQLCCQCY